MALNYAADSVNMLEDLISLSGRALSDWEYEFVFSMSLQRQRKGERWFVGAKQFFKLRQIWRQRVEHQNS